jgi:glyoxylase-like metal-dependent hydrolase (beta-lactamase superfamily II)
MHILNLGIMNVDEAYLLQGANGSSASDPHPVHQRRDLAYLAALIEHPEAGLILYETGGPEEIEEHWGPQRTDLFPRTTYDKSIHSLPAALAALGHKVDDIKAVIMGHLHLDHAGGLEHFFDTSVPIYVHEEEFKYACWAVATQSDGGVYLSDYLALNGSLNWQTFSGAHVDLFRGVTLHHCPGHTPGLCAMQVNLAGDGTFLFTSDHAIVKENYYDAHPQGWLARDHVEWVRSSQMLKRIQRAFGATVVFGHDIDVVEELWKAKRSWQ